MNAHTPGPWCLERCTARNEWSLAGASYAGRFIGTARDMEEADANARLIAAAPTMQCLHREAYGHRRRRSYFDSGGH